VNSGTHLGPKFEDAVRYAVIAHAGQRRKGTQIPYVAHLLAVSSLVLEAGGTEVQAIAALLHDAAEDCGGQPRLDDIRHRYGKKVEDATEKAPWKVRKAQYLEHLIDTKPDVLLVSLADKLHNATAILRDVRADGDTVFERFKGKRVGTLWYYGALVKTFDKRSNELTSGGRVLLEELRVTVEAIDKCSDVAAR
jgi:(p)ppGpp synthase/HD superfamily hydrolase